MVPLLCFSLPASIFSLTDHLLTYSTLKTSCSKSSKFSSCSYRHNLHLNPKWLGAHLQNNLSLGKEFWENTATGGESSGWSWSWEGMPPQLTAQRREWQMNKQRPIVFSFSPTCPLQKQNLLYLVSGSTKITLLNLQGSGKNTITLDKLILSLVNILKY